jgi:hypothetical protein
MVKYSVIYPGNKIDVEGELPRENEIYEVLEGKNSQGFRVKEVRHVLVRETRSLEYEVRLDPLK